MPPRRLARTTPDRSDRYHHGDLRAVLLRAGEAELAEHGIEGFSLRGVAKRAGVSHAAPAHHFGDVNGLLTSLAAEGFRRFLDKQRLRQRKSADDSLSLLVAAGMGYIDFAVAHPALFRLMFSSDRPNHEDGELGTAASAAYRQLVADVKRQHGDKTGSTEPDPLDIMRVWAAAHGLADLLIARRLKPLLAMRKAERDAALAKMLRRSFAA